MYSHVVVQVHMAFMKWFGYLKTHKGGKWTSEPDSSKWNATLLIMVSRCEPVNQGNEMIHMDIAMVFMYSHVVGQIYMTFIEVYGYLETHKAGKWTSEPDSWKGNVTLLILVYRCEPVSQGNDMIHMDIVMVFICIHVMGQAHKTFKECHCYLENQLDKQMNKGTWLRK